MTVNTINSKKEIISWFAKEIASLRQIADEWLYLKGNMGMYNKYLDRAYTITQFSIKINIASEVNQEALKIYDFRNSGKQGFTYKNGKLIPIQGE